MATGYRARRPSAKRLAEAPPSLFCPALPAALNALATPYEAWLASDAGAEAFEFIIDLGAMRQTSVLTGERRAVAPRAFKRAVARCKPQFAGSEQQDAQEFLVELLDMLHEDGNRVLEKPFVAASSSAYLVSRRLTSWSSRPATFFMSFGTSASLPGLHRR